LGRARIRLRIAAAKVEIRFDAHDLGLRGRVARAVLIENAHHVVSQKSCEGPERLAVIARRSWAYEATDSLVFWEVPWLLFLLLAVTKKTRSAGMRAWRLGNLPSAPRAHALHP